MTTTYKYLAINWHEKNSEANDTTSNVHTGSQQAILLMNSVINCLPSSTYSSITH